MNEYNCRNATFDRGTTHPPRYHHLSVLISVFYCFSNFTPYVRWFMVMNYMVHSVMYSYYTLKALRFQTFLKKTIVV